MDTSTVQRIADTAADERATLLRVGIRSLVVEAHQPLPNEWVYTTEWNDERRLLRCLGIADLCRVPGVGSQTARLLFRAGIATASALATADACALSRRLRTLNRSEHVCRAAPGRATVSAWIASARALPALPTGGEV